MSSLFSNIASDSTSRIRLLTKFVEGNYEKVDKLLEIRDSAKARLASTEAEIEKEKKVRPILVPYYIYIYKRLGQHGIFRR
jgi:beta-catenin-like protein 1